MVFSRPAIGAIVAALVWGPCAWAHAHGAHVHGLAAMEIAIDSETVEVNLITPLNNLVGFEHAPGNEKQREAVKSMASKLHRADNLFILTPAARCRSISVKLESPVLPPDLLMPALLVGKSANRNPARNADEAGDGSRNDPSDNHGELQAAWQFQCSNPQALQGMDVKLFQTFPALQRLDVAVASPKGQASGKLSPASTQVRW